MIAQAARFLVLALLAFAPVIPAWAVDAPWIDYFGSHYEDAPWAASVRDPGGPGRYGYRVEGHRSAGSREPPSKWAGSGQAEELRPQLVRGAIVLNVGGLGSGRDPSQASNFLDSVRADGGAQWKRELAERVRRVAVLPGASEHAYWQFGNEINGPRFLENVVRWGGGRGGRGDMAAAMRAFIPLYVEYFLAPGVEAVRNVGRDVHGDPGRIHVMLGSLANARNPLFVRWYEELLGYTVQGSNAPSLAGRKVHEIVDALAVHYLVSAPDDGWRDILDQLANDWVGRGAIKAIWSTEEIGVRRAQSGHGAVTALRVAGRYLDWWAARGWDAGRGHCFFWGWDMGASGTRADDALRALFDFTGRATLQPMRGASASGAEHYLFSVADGRRRVLLVFPGADAGSAARVFVPAHGWNKTPRATALLFTPKGMRRLTLDAGAGKGGFDLALPRIESAQDAALMILLESA
jgi:hypothetical protein